jgi:hypothetical protein
MLQKAAIRLVSSVLIGVALSACSVSSAHPSSSSSTSPASTTNAQTSRIFLTTHQVDAQPAGSPAHAVLAFWQDVQLDDFPDVLASLSPSFVSHYAHNLNHLASYISADQPRWMTRPTVQTTARSGQSARVIVSFVLNGAPTPMAFDLQLINGKWLISYNFYLIGRLTASTPTANTPTTGRSTKRH